MASDGERYPTDVIYIKTAESEGAVLHPTQKPIELGRYMVRTYTNPGDVVLDNTFGSGSFLVIFLNSDLDPIKKTCYVASTFLLLFLISVFYLKNLFTTLSISPVFNTVFWVSNVRISRSPA